MYKIFKCTTCKKHLTLLFMATILLLACTPDQTGPVSDLTIIFINDQHGQIDNFGKLKHLIDQEKQEGEVIVACSGDMFSGNPVVDIYEEKGYPMIDLMNRLGFDIAVLGNHEFDYGQNVLSNRFDQSEFEWVCANVNMADTEIPQPKAFTTLQAGDLSITFLGLLETNGKDNQNIPSTHPLKVEGVHFERPENVVGAYSNLKEEEGADLLIALTHLGHYYSNGNLGDFKLAQQYPFFDMIIGGHSDPVLDTTINGIPVFHAGNYLNYAGKIDIQIKNKKIVTIDFEAIDLNSYPEKDNLIQSVIQQYNDEMEGPLEEVIGYSDRYHERYEVGCFYTDALKESLGTDLSFQNSGGIRNSLDDGDITVREIYEIDPFNNMAMIYTMTCREIKTFIRETSSWHAYSGIQIDIINGEIILRYPDGNQIDDDQVLKVGINDYIPAVDDGLFPPTGEILPYTTAEALISYLKNIDNHVSYPDCDRYVKFQ